MPPIGMCRCGACGCRLTGLRSIQLNIQDKCIFSSRGSISNTLSLVKQMFASHDSRRRKLQWQKASPATSSPASCYSLELLFGCKGKARPWLWHQVAECSKHASSLVIKENSETHSSAVSMRHLTALAPLGGNLLSLTVQANWQEKDQDCSFVAELTRLTGDCL